MSSRGEGVLRVAPDDREALVDVPHFYAEQGRAPLGQEDLGHPCHAYLIRRGG